MPPNLFTCESLVSLKLSYVDLCSPKFVSLPSLKVMDLYEVRFANELEFETLISGCPILGSLYMKRNLLHDFLEVLRVCSQSLLSFTHVCNRFDDLEPCETEDLVVEISAPRLQYLRLGDFRIANYILNTTSSLVEANIDSVFNWWSFEFNFEDDLQKRKMFRSFLERISCVKDMTITAETLEVIYHYSECEQLPLFRNLSYLRVRFANYRWEMLQIFLESCPNLQCLVVASFKYPEPVAISPIIFLSGPRCLLSSLEYVDIERPLKGEVMEMELLSYFLKNSAILKSLSVRLDASMETEKESAVLKVLLIFPRLSSSCQVVVL